MQSTKTQYYSVVPSEFKLDGGAMFGIIPKPLWEKKIHSDETNRINMALRVLVIKTQEKIILIDSGIGDYHPEKFQDRHNINASKSPLVATLEKNLNITAEQITDIIPSHLHFDHVGGFSQKIGNEIKPVFPNATLHLHRQHYEYSLNPKLRDAGSFQKHYFEPMIEEYKNKSLINWLSKDSGVILKDNDYELNYRCSHGHTPFQVHPYDNDLIFMGDLTPTHAHISPVWVMGYDMQPGVSSDERIEFYDFVQKNQLTMIYDHDIEYWGSKVEKSEKGYKAIDLQPQSHPSFAQILKHD